MEWSGINQALGSTLEITKFLLNSGTGTTLTVVGLFLVGTGCVLSYIFMKMPPAEATLLRRIVVLFVLLSGIAFSVAGPSMSLLRQVKVSEDQALRLTTPDDEVESLRTNERVTRLVRLIAYDPSKDPELAVGKLTSLGRKSQRYTFVSDYNALRGRVVAEAVRMSGIHLDGGYRVTAVIFPLGNDRIIYPVNARGLLQVIQQIEAAEPALDKFDVKSRIPPAAWSNLQSTRPISSWSWDSYKAYYPAFCDAAQEFRCHRDRYGVSGQIGDLSDDWHPLGFARKEPPRVPPCEQRAADICTGGEWADLKKGALMDFGSRIFLTENADLASLNGRMILDFDAPHQQRIPIVPP